jgi:hypothetical protein
MKAFASVLILFLFLSAQGFTKSAIPSPASEINNPPRWEKLGERRVNFGVDHDEIMVTASEGRFSALKIMVKKGGINMHKMVVHFGDGSSEEIELRNDIPAGGESRVIDLPGKKRVIRKVVFWYDTKNFADRKAEVELWGRH